MYGISHLAQVRRVFPLISLLGSLTLTKNLRVLRVFVSSSSQIWLTHDVLEVVSSAEDAVLEISGYSWLVWMCP